MTTKLLAMEQTFVAEVQERVDDKLKLRHPNGAEVLLPLADLDGVTPAERDTRLISICGTLIPVEVAVVADTVQVRELPRPLGFQTPKALISAAIKAMKVRAESYRSRFSGVKGIAEQSDDDITLLLMQLSRLAKSVDLSTTEEFACEYNRIAASVLSTFEVYEARRKRLTGN